MVSARFNITGEDSEWMRVRLSEEIHAHGLDGSVMKADDGTLVVVIEGDNSKIKRFYTDVAEFTPEGVEVHDIIYSLQRRPRRVRMREPPRKVEDETLDYMLQYMREIEKTTQRLDQKLNTVIAHLEGYAGSEFIQKSEETFEEQDMEVEEEASTGFAAMFGD